MNGDTKPDADAIAQKYGGRAQVNPDAVARKYGGTPTADTTPPPPTVSPGSVSLPGLEASHPYLAAAVEGPLDVLSGAGGELFSQAGRVAGLVSPRAGKFLSQYGQDVPGVTQGLGRLGVQAAEFAAPAGLEKTGATLMGKALATAPKIVRSAGELLPAALSSGTVSALQGTGFGPGAVLGAVGAPIGKALRTMGGGMAARAAGVTEKQLRYGAEPGEEILGLKGILPKTIRESAASEVRALTTELESEAARGGVVDMTPVKEELSKAIDRAANQNDITTFEHLKPLADQVSTLPNSAPARDALEYKRGLGTLAKFYKASPLTDKAQGAARAVYGSMDKELDAAVPKANELDDRIHSLLTIAAPKGAGGMGLGKYMLPWIAARAIGAAGGGPLGELAAMGTTFAGESPAGRIALGKGIAALPMLGRVARAPLLGAVKPAEGNQ